MCLLHRALELGGREAQVELAVEQLETLVMSVVEDGAVHPDDAAEAVADAIGVARGRRHRAGVGDVPRASETRRALDALSRFDRLEEVGA